MLLLAYKYLDRPREALVVNANLGGDSCHRGALLGLILGAAAGRAGLPVDLLDRLRAAAPDAAGLAEALAALAATRGPSRAAGRSEAAGAGAGACGGGGLAIRLPPRAPRQPAAAAAPAGGGGPDGGSAACGPDGT